MCSKTIFTFYLFIYFLRKDTSSNWYWYWFT